jgi:NADPH:quinone reductase-like Zn-dependent oxidoreductase
MKAHQFEKFGAGLAGLALVERPEPKPGRSEVLIRVHARSLNFRDVRILAGLYPVPARLGITALSDGAGEVVAIGEDVTRVAVGERVAASYFPQWRDGRFAMQLALDQYGCTRDGMLAPLALADENAVVRIPSHLSYEEAATLPCAGVTAWAALRGPRPVVPGDTVLTIGSGGVALFALQFARMFGARVIALTSTEAKAEQLKKLGADEVVNYRAVPEWAQRRVRELTDGGGVEHVIDTGGLDTLPRSIAATREEGVVTVVAALGPGQLNPLVFANPVMVRRVYVGSRAHFEAMNRAISAHHMKPVIDRVFGFEQTKQAFEHFEARRHVGKVVIAGD